MSDTTDDSAEPKPTVTGDGSVRLLRVAPVDSAVRIAELEAAILTQRRRLAGMVTIASNLARSRDPRKVMRAIVAEISALLEADRTTIYEHRPESGMLEGLAVQGEKSVEVGVPVGTGIAGLVAEKGRAINLKDAYLHPAFDPKFDVLTGYRTRSMLCVPMRTPNREVVGVVQVLNKRGGYFSVDDQHLLESLAAQAAITLEALRLQLRLNISNAELHSVAEELRQRVAELELLDEIGHAAGDADDIARLVEPTLRRAATVARAQAAAVFLPTERGTGPVYFCEAGGETELEVLAAIEVGEGLLGKTASRGQAYDLRPGGEAEDGIERMLCRGDVRVVTDAQTVPLIDGGQTVGAFALLNRRALDRRELDEDERLAFLLAGQLARAVTRLNERQSAQQKDRLMTIGQMLSGVLHDLTGPMAIISGYSQLMADLDEPDERHSMAEAIRRQVAHFNGMTREVLSFARGERSVFCRKVLLNHFVALVRELVAPEFAQRGMAFIVEATGTGVAFFDEGKMLRVVTNIARNARQAMGPQGSFTWRLTDTAGGGVQFSMTDTGPGIPMSMRDKLFDAFTTADKADGTGLGLAIVRRIVEDHRGQVTFTTELGRGTTFVVTLPPQAASNES